MAHPTFPRPRTTRRSLLTSAMFGSIPWVIIMVLMTLLVILFPGMVSLSIQIFGRF